ncbi:MAG: hypothetical protein IJZ19_05810 [Lentisphaeria bacterium]|nr:hypothetical protein [Lentisphaeria bacterium]
MFQIKKLFYEFASPQDLGLHKDLPVITFRGAFGYALAQVIARSGCIPALASQVQLYRQFFMPQNSGEYESHNRDLARPFVLRGFYSRPDLRSFILEVVLFGRAIEHEDFFDKVIEVMSYMGIGKNNTVCHFKKLDALSVVLNTQDPTEQLEVKFLTPCAKLKHHGKIFEEYVPFYVLLPRLVDRLIELDNIYGDGSFIQEWDVHAMKHQAQMIAETVVNGGVYLAKRISGRTGQEMNLSGFVGTMLYDGDFKIFREPLCYLPFINLGRFNVFGCGWCTARFI